MAYTLKSTGPAAKAKVVVAVDEDGTVKAWTTPGSTATLTPSSGLTVHANVATGTSSFRTSGTRSYFETDYDASTRAAEGVYFNTNIDLTTRTVGKGMSWVGVMAGFTGNDTPTDSTPSVLCQWARNSINTASVAESVMITQGSSPVTAAVRIGDFNRATTVSTIPTDGTSKFTLVGQYINSGTYDGHTGPKSMFFYCAEGSAGSTVTAFERTNLAESTVQPNEALRLTGVGGSFNPDDNASPGDPVAGRAAAGKYHVWAAFDDLLTLAEAQAIHDDWFGTLFESAAGPTLTSPTGTATGTTTATVGATTDTATGTLYGFVSTSATPPAAATLKAGTGAAWSGSVAVSSTGAKTLSATGLSAGTGYYAHLIHTDGSANDSNIVTSAQFTTTSLTKKLKVLCHSSAASATGVKGAVFAVPTGTDLTGAKIGEFTGASFEASLEGGQAVLKVAASGFGGGSLTTSDTPVVVFEGTTDAGSSLGNAVSFGSVGVHEATVIEE